MKLKDKVREWLGINILSRTIMQQQQALEIMAKDRNALIAHNLALGRIVAKLDPAYTIMQDDLQNPETRKALRESNRIGQSVIDKLWAEHAARDPSR